MTAPARSELRVETLWLPEGLGVPNNPRLPVRFCRSAVPAGAPQEAEAALAARGWSPAWRNGIFPYVHFHTTAHEVLAIVRGSVRVQLGGGEGPEMALAAGDVVMLPAGTGHRCLGASGNLMVVGAYPPGQEPDEWREVGEAEMLACRARIARLTDPPSCPITGETYPRRA